MTHSGPTIAEIKSTAQARIFDVLAGLGIRDVPRGKYISMCNPVEKDRHPSFTIWTAGAAVGAFKDHRGLAQGDVIDLVAYIKGWSDGPKKGRREALRWLADHLGLARMTSEQRRADASRSRARADRAEKDRAEDLATKQERARELFFAAASILGTRADTYLADRGIDLQALPQGPRGGSRVPKLLRAIESHPHADSGRSWPCMIAACTDCGTREILAVHRTWLALNGIGKAPVSPPKKVFPDFRGLVIPLWRGESNLSVREANNAGLRETLVLAEGIETALSAAIAAPAYRTWAFISLGNLQNVVLPECIDSVALHRENDTSPAAIKSYERGKAALERQGRPVAEIEAFAGKDLNDTLRGAA